MRFNTDKVTHGYLPTYLMLAGEIGIDGHIVELGVDRGGSLEMWQTLFPEGVVVGVDRSAEATWPPGVWSIVCEQDDPALVDKLRDVCPEFDLIVDDASHLGDKTRATFDMLWPLVGPGRTYVIEDWQIGFDDWPGYDRSMLTLAEGLVGMVHDVSVDTITYRHGQIIIRKAP